MIIGALLDCGASWEYLHRSLSSLSVEVAISSQPKVVQGIRSTSFTVKAKEEPVRHLSQFEKIIDAGNLSRDVKQNSRKVFHKLAHAEATVHGIKPEEVHFHEIGATDTLVDIVGTFLCLESLQIDQVFTSPLPWANGFVDISHGRYPLPAPATAYLLNGFPCVASKAGIELVTPTGAALITSITDPSPAPATFTPEQVGYGAGDYQRTDGVPNLLRVIKATASSSGQASKVVGILETEVDDLNPEFFTHLHQIFTSHPGVLDFFTTPVQMKKNRPGTLITLITRPDSLESLSDLLMRETGTLGVRFRRQERFTAPRTEEKLATPWGPVRIKISQLAANSVRIKPEYDDCQAIAQQHGLSLLEVYAAVNALAERQGK